MENNFSLAQQLALLLISKKLKLAVAESCTGGGLSFELTQISGSSNWFDRGFVVYSNQAKIEMLKVEVTTIEKYGAVSRETALQMAKGALAQSAANLTLSITGIAGPEGGTIEKPVGTVWMGLAISEEQVYSQYLFLTGGRHQIRQDAVAYALKWLLAELKNI